MPRWNSHQIPPPMCGCFIIFESVRKYIPQVQVNAHTTILASTSRTTLTQTFTNPYQDKALSELRYVFPLYDGVSVVAFTCTVGNRVIKGVVKEREKAKQVYKEATDRGETAGLFEQSLDAADVFTTTIGNVPAGEKIKVDITYLGELKHDAEVDGVRFTIPTHIVPRYGKEDCLTVGQTLLKDGGISITVDAEMPDGSAIKSIQSPSHPISVNIGTISTASSADPSLQRASATLSLGSAKLEKDFIVQVVATNLGNPTAILETHPTIPNQRALMATLVPKFNLPADKPEIVFVCDRSGSMTSKIPDLKAALQIFLKSLPVGVKFNICSFGSKYDFLWSKSKTYSQDSLDKAVKHVQKFDANYGGTEMYGPVGETFKRRYKDMNLEVFLLTDGEIWDQEKLFALINDQVAESKGAIRVFTLGVGSGASSALIEGAARAGKGFAQLVHDNEKMDKKVVRMLKGALFPHITDYSLEIKYEKAESNSEDDFEVVEKVMDALKIDTSEKVEEVEEVKAEAPKQPMSLFNPNLKEDDTPMPDAPPSVDNKYDHLPAVPAPRYLQTPFEIPPLFPFNRTTVYVLLSDTTPEQKPKSVLLKGTSLQGPLELEIPITTLAEKGTTIHQLAARKEVKELEEGRGWLTHAKDSTGKPLKTKHEGRFTDMVEREAVRLGVGYQVGGKWCSFVAVQENNDSPSEGDEKELGEFQVISAKDTVGRASFNHVATRGYAMASIGSAPMASFSRTGGVTLNRSAAPVLQARQRTNAPCSSAGAPPPPRGGGLFGSMGGGGYARPKAAAPAIQESSDDEEMGFGLFDSGAPAAAAAAPLPPPSASATAFGSNAPAYGGPSAPSGGGFGGTLALSAPLGATFGSAPAGESKKLKKKSFSFSPFGRSSSRSSSSSPPAKSVDTNNPLQALISLQTFVGSWTWSADLEKVLGVTAKKAGRLNVSGKIQGDVLATLCAVVFLKTKLREDKESWEMLVEKAEDWLKEQQGESVEELEKQVEGLF
ncbi:Fc.00g035040.m01.CDS01 [Cosmosporella sp. VM-42]